MRIADDRLIFELYRESIKPPWYFQMKRKIREEIEPEGRYTLVIYSFDANRVENIIAYLSSINASFFQDDEGDFVIQHVKGSDINPFLDKMEEVANGELVDGDTPGDEDFKVIKE